MNDEKQTESPRKKIEFAKNLSVIFVIPIYTILHFMQGFRFLKPLILVVNAAALILFTIFFSALAKPFPILMPLFAVATLACGLIQRNCRWRELLRGQTWLSFSNGIPWIERFRWPEFLRRESRLVRFVEPALVWLVGLPVAIFLSRAFGIYLMITSAFMLVFQQMVYEASINHLFDMLDNLIFADAQSLNLAYFNTKNPTVLPPSVKELEGVSTGLSPELLKAIERKRAKRLNPPDNMTPVMTQRA